MLQDLADLGMDSDEFRQAYKQVEAALEADEFFGEGSAACRVPAILELKVGAQVMLLRNERAGGFVNGDTGVVMGFEQVQPESPEAALLKEMDLGSAAMGMRWPRVRFKRTTRAGHDEKLCLPVRFERNVYRRGKCVRLQVPLALSWAIT